MWQKQIRYFNAYEHPCALLLLLFIAAGGCTKADLQYGSQLTGDAYTQVVMTDTFSLRMNTVYVDSFITSGTGTALTGSYNDEAFGNITASSYFQLQPPAFTEEMVSYDSIELVLFTDHSYYGDSTTPFSLSVYQLSQAITKKTSSNFYSYDSFPVNPTPLGTKTLSLNPKSTDSIAVRLSDALGRDLLYKLKSQAEEVASVDNFIYFFKGIHISAGTPNALIFGYSDSVEIRLHYKETNGTWAQEKTASFTLYDNSKQFNHINADRAGTDLQSLSPSLRTLSSATTAHSAFSQFSTGVVAKIEVPYISDILQQSAFVKIERAVLFVKPVAGTYLNNYLLPDSLRLSQTTQNNTFGSDLTYSDGSVQYGAFSRDYLFEKNTAYSFDVTTYLTNQLTEPAGNGNGLLLSAPQPASTASFSRVVIGDAQHPTSPSQLQIYYLSVKQ